MACNAPWSCPDCPRHIGINADCPGSDNDGWRGQGCVKCKNDHTEDNCAECPCFKCDDESCIYCAHDWVG